MFSYFCFFLCGCVMPGQKTYPAEHVCMQIHCYQHDTACNLAIGCSATDKHNIVHVSMDLSFTVTSVMALKGGFCLSMCSLGLVSRHESGGAKVRHPSLGLSWKNSSLICQHEDKYFTTKHVRLRQPASTSP